MINLEAVRVRGRKRPRLNDVTLRLRPGVVYGLVGPNGAGKTTLMSVIAGLVAIDGGAVSGLPVRPSKAIGVVSTTEHLHPGRTVRETLSIRAALVGADKLSVQSALREAGLSEVARRRTRQLSLGMKMRLAIAAALLGNPPLIMLDEPMNGLDPDGVRWIRSTISSLRAQSRTVIVSSHLLAELERVVDVAVVMSQGSLVGVEDLGQSASSYCRISTDRPDDFAAELASNDMECERDGADFVLAMAVSEAVQFAISRGFAVNSAIPTGRGLDQLYADLTHGEHRAEAAK